MMFITGKNVYIRNEKIEKDIKGYNVDILHYCSTNKSYAQYKIHNKSWISNLRGNDYIVPRAVMSGLKYNVVTLSTLNNMVNLVEWVNDDSECSNCPYSENCDGQMCFFAEV